MTTTIKSTELDFNEIKNNLKVFLAKTPEFRDYNFEGSALSSLLDVLAYNTHYNSLLANFALNESFLSTAQLRSSLVSLAGGLGYQVGSKTASCGVVNLWVTNPLVPNTMTLQEGFRFSTVVNNVSYIFKTRQTLIATNNGSNQYYFRLGENQNVAIYEGRPEKKLFIAGPVNENESYIIPTENIDLDTVQVRVYDDPSTIFYDVYTNINDATSIEKDSKIFVIKETPNGQYELTFGNGARLGKFPTTGNKIEVLYDAVAGPLANGARTFTPIDQVLDGNGDILSLNVVTVVGSRGGQLKEPIESIRRNAPYLYAAQNRMVTAQDYASLTLRKYSNNITDIKAWGGEDNIPPKYGSVFLSIVFNTPSVDVQEATKAGIRSLVKDLSVASFDIEFTDPITTYLEINTTFQWNSNLTSSSQTQIENVVKTTIADYFSDNLGGFDKSFRRSNLLTAIDECDPSVLSSKADVKMQYRFIPTSSQVSYTLEYPTSIASPDDEIHTLVSDNFVIGNKTCFFRNKLGSTTIEVINIASGTALVDSIGTYDPVSGTITLNNFTGNLISTNPYIKIKAIPANQATINAQRNNVLAFDGTASISTAVLTNTV